MQVNAHFIQSDFQGSGPRRGRRLVVLGLCSASPIGETTKVNQEEHQYWPHARAPRFFRPCSQKNRVAKNRAYDDKYKCRQPEFLHVRFLLLAKTKGFKSRSIFFCQLRIEYPQRGA